MGLFSEQSVPIPADVVRILQAVADVATIGIIQERAVREGEVVTNQPPPAIETTAQVIDLTARDRATVPDYPTEWPGSGVEIEPSGA